MLDFEDFKQKYQKVPVKEYPNNVREAVPEPVVSVHISTYQHSDFIQDCLNGVLMQETDFPMEVIIGEDESDDGTREICKEYAERYPETVRLFLHRRENNISVSGKPTGRFQFTYSQFVARGKYVAICEGDDYWKDSKKIQKQVEFLERNRKYSYCYHPFMRVRIIKSEGEKIKNVIGEDEKWAATSTILKRGKISKVPCCYFKVLHADTFLKRKLELDGPGYRINEIDPSVYRIHEGGIYGDLNKNKKMFEVLRSNLLIYPYFKNTESENRVKRDIIRFLRNFMKSKNSANKFYYLLSIAYILYRVGVMKEVIFSVLKLEAGQLLPSTIVSYVKSKTGSD